MEFTGLNTGADKTDLPDGASPDCSNVFFANGRKGQIGPRKGRTLVSSSAYANAVYGASKFILPDGSRKWMVSHGTVSNQENAPNASVVYRSFTDTVEKLTFDPISLTETEVTGAVTQKESLSASLVAGTYDLLIPGLYTLTGAFSGGDEEGEITFSVQLLQADDSAASSKYNVELHSGIVTSFLLDRSSGSLVRVLGVTVSATATQIQFELSTTPSTATAHTITITGGLSYILAKKA